MTDGEVRFGPLQIYRSLTGGGGGGGGDVKRFSQGEREDDTF